MKKISIFGVTGSIGASSIDVIQKSPANQFEVMGLSAHSNYQKLAEYAINTNAKLAVITNERFYYELKSLLSGTDVKAAAGNDGIQEICGFDNDLVIAAVVGSAGLYSTYQAIKSGTNIALANKESLVCGGNIIIQECIKNKIKLIPVDSEHNAIFQVLDIHNLDAVSSITLTASGGPFRNYTFNQLEKVTVREALNHPNWNMGQKITIDSASLFNKGLELIEAHHLFNMPIDKIEVLIHPESIIHSMVNYKDGSTLAQLGKHDMRIPITHALYWPKRYRDTNIIENLDFSSLAQLSFATPDYKKFPSLNLCKDAIKIGGTAPIILNASNEVAVDLFLKNKIKFTNIFQIVEKCISNYSHHSISSISEIIRLDSQYKKELLSSYYSYIQ